MQTKIFFSALFILLFNSFLLKAQSGTPGGDCGFADVDTTCPIDTWVYILAAVALVFAAVHLYRKQKSGVL